MICYVHPHSSVLSSLLTIASKHDGSDSTALPNENGQLGVGLLQIDIVASYKLNSLQRRHIIDHQHHSQIQYVPQYKQRLSAIIHHC